MTSYPNNLEEAITLATEASQNIRKRKSFGGQLALPDNKLRRTALSVNALAPVYSDASIANLAESFQGATTDTAFLNMICEVCHISPDVNNIVHSSQTEVSGLRAGVNGVLQNAPSYRQACNAIQNLTPTKFVKRTSATRSEEAHYDNLDQLTNKEIKALYKKRQMIETLRSKPSSSLDSPSSDDEDDEQKEPERKVRASRRHKNPSLDVAFMDECLNAIDVCAAEAVCNKCQKPGHYFRFCPDLKNSDGTFGPYCPFCKGAHTIQTCEKLLSILCNKCNKKGHTARFCPSNACTKCDGPHHVSRCRQ
jgi:hypothetical protein